MRVKVKMPTTTSAVPAATHTVNGSPKIHTPMRMVDSGPTMPVWAAMPAPMRSMAIITISTGRRNADAVRKLESLGYTRLYDLGGILSWPYEIEGDFEGHF